MKMKDGQIDGRSARKSGTYLDLEQYLAKHAEMSEIQNWPEVKMWDYPTGRGADVQAWRVRKGLIRLPDHEGGDQGEWEARVERVKKGTDNVNGPCRVYVRYVGVRGTVRSAG